MPNQYPIRYGRNYKVVLAIVLPCLLIIPFIFLMQNEVFKTWAEWEIWAAVFLFLGLLIALCLFLVFRVYPSAVLVINDNVFSIQFERSNWFGPTDFSFRFDEIVSFTSNFIGTDEYFLIKTKNPNHTFQISAASRSYEEIVAFENAMISINERLNGEDS